MYNRPFDDQSLERVQRETVATIEILERIRKGNLELVWSYINEYENVQNPFLENSRAIGLWRERANAIVVESPRLLRNAYNLVELGVRALDALHVASAVEGNAALFLSTDDKLLRKLSVFEEVRLLDPITALETMDEYIN
ncbi:MAG TPA: PIN domain-containing protein [Pyrinomonadaceae bacterium]|nr:PIN domain-containing protein [Pyrinomonadaceae bacterium]